MAGLPAPGSLHFGAIDQRGRIREWDAASNRFLGDEDEAPDLGAELLEEEIIFMGGGPIGGSMIDGNGGCYAGLDFIGDVGRDPMSSNVND